MNSTPKILYLGSDHGGFTLKEFLKSYLSETNPEWTVVDLGIFSEEAIDYPDIANTVAQAVVNAKGTQGIICCGTGIGVSMMANRHKGIRAAVVHDVFTATMAKEHNNANIICLGGRTTPPELAAPMVDAWLTTPFSEGRHTRRIEKLDSLA